MKLLKRSNGDYVLTTSQQEMLNMLVALRADYARGLHELLSVDGADGTREYYRQREKQLTLLISALLYAPRDEEVDCEF